ncbi:hypothetical protein OSI85_25335, partial [Mycobacterium ulcerans]
MTEVTAVPPAMVVAVPMAQIPLSASVPGTAGTAELAAMPAQAGSVGKAVPAQPRAHRDLTAARPRA